MYMYFIPIKFEKFENLTFKLSVMLETNQRDTSDLLFCIQQIRHCFNVVVLFFFSEIDHYSSILKIVIQLSK